MLLAIDIGNSAIKFGIFDAADLKSKFSIPTKRDATADELRSLIADNLSAPIDAAIACSVVPDLEQPLGSAIAEITGIEPAFVTNSFDFGLKINYEPLDALGTDRLVNAYSAVEHHGAPIIVCSLGTATTIDAVSRDREFLGGIIAPGLDAMARALHLAAPRLPEIQIEPTPDLIGSSTTASIRSGVYNGYVSMVNGLIERMKDRMGGASVVATGGRATLVAADCDAIKVVDPDLLLHGLRSLAPQE